MLLVAFVASSDARGLLSGARRAEFTRFVERELESQGGAIRITKDSGIFEAYRL